MADDSRGEADGIRAVPAGLASNTSGRNDELVMLEPDIHPHRPPFFEQLDVALELVNLVRKVGVDVCRLKWGGRSEGQNPARDGLAGGRGRHREHQERNVELVEGRLGQVRRQSERETKAEVATTHLDRAQVAEHEIDLARPEIVCFVLRWNDGRDHDQRHAVLLCALGRGQHRSVVFHCTADGACQPRAGRESSDKSLTSEVSHAHPVHDGQTSRDGRLLDRQSLIRKRLLEGVERRSSFQSVCVRDLRDSGVCHK